MEWIVKDIRSITGKKLGKGQSVQMIGVIHQLIPNFVAHRSGTNNRKVIAASMPQESRLPEIVNEDVLTERFEQI